MDLFEYMRNTNMEKESPLAARLRPKTLEEVVGQQVSILANLEPKLLKGIESQGMILMAENADGSLAFVRPDKEVKAGSEIR